MAPSRTMEDIPEIVRIQNGFESFNTIQNAFLKSNWQQKSIVVAAPTASGKTITAELAALDAVLNHRKKAIYTCPLRALAAEHFSDFKKKYGPLKIKACLSTGDLDSAASYLERFDVIFTTFEKLDSLLRHETSWLSQIGVLVIDEVHELDSDRGPTIEMVITKLRVLNARMRLLALSATIPNASELSKWLDAELVESDFRPVALREGVYMNHSIRFGGQLIPVATHHSDALLEVVHDTLLSQQKQVLVFCATRKSAESTAEKISKLCAQHISDHEKSLLNKTAHNVLNALEIPSKQCEQLSGLIAKGVVFHHAGLVSKQRELIEESFKNNHLKVICATPTLAAGVNLPAFRVVINSVYRFGNSGSERIPVREYKQMVGRAGRPKYDSFGESVILAKSETDADFLDSYYVQGQLEAISSKLGIAPILRMHLLSCIANRFVFDQLSLQDFFGKTFYAHQYGDMDRFYRIIIDMLGELAKMGFVEINQTGFTATKLGQRVSELYIDPLTAQRFIKHLHKGDSSIFSNLVCIAKSFEMEPYPSLPKEKQLLLWDLLTDRQADLGDQADVFENPDLLQQLSMALLLEYWMSEKGENFLLEEFNIAPGTLRQKLERADWLLYCLVELAKVLELPKNQSAVNRLRERLQYGIKEELIPLVQLRGIGRVRARKLYHAGLTRLGDIKNAPIEKLNLLLGDAVAESVKKQLLPQEKTNEEDVEPGFQQIL